MEEKTNLPYSQEKFERFKKFKEELKLTQRSRKNDKNIWKLEANKDFHGYFAGQEITFIDEDKKIYKYFLSHFEVVEVFKHAIIGRAIPIFKDLWNMGKILKDVIASHDTKILDEDYRKHLLERVVLTCNCNISTAYLKLESIEIIQAVYPEIIFKKKIGNTFPHKAIELMESLFREEGFPLPNQENRNTREKWKRKRKRKRKKEENNQDNIEEDVPKEKSVPGTGGKTPRKIRDNLENDYKELRGRFEKLKEYVGQLEQSVENKERIEIQKEKLNARVRELDEREARLDKREAELNAREKKWELQLSGRQNFKTYYGKYGMWTSSESSASESEDGLDSEEEDILQTSNNQLSGPGNK